MESATAPDLAKNPAIAKNFKIYDATEQTKGAERRFTYSLRPLTAELKEFPPIEASYFNAKTEQFDRSVRGTGRQLRSATAGSTLCTPP